MRSLEVLIVRNNKIKSVEGPFSDLTEASEKQLKKEIMKLQVLDIRDNGLGKIHLEEAHEFLRDTVVLMWGNPFTAHQKEGEQESLQESAISKEYYFPSSIFRQGGESL